MAISERWRYLLYQNYVRIVALTLVLRKAPFNRNSELVL